LCGSLWPGTARQRQSFQHFAFAGMELLFPPPTNATNQPPDRTTRNTLILGIVNWDLRGLQVSKGSEAGEKNGQERVKTAKSGRPRETPKSTGTRTNPRQDAGVPRKSPDRERPGLLVWWARRDLNPGPKDYACHYDFRRPFRVCGLDYTFPLQAGRLVSTPFPVLLGDLARYWLVPKKLASTEFDQFYPPPEAIWRRTTHENNHAPESAQVGLAKSSALTD